MSSSKLSVAPTRFKPVTHHQPDILTDETETINELIQANRKLLKEMHQLKGALADQRWELGLAQTSISDFLKLHRLAKNFISITEKEQQQTREGKELQLWLDETIPPLPDQAEPDEIEWFLDNKRMVERGEL